jgi:nucleoside-diphosphate-sugar epimerase
VRSALVVGASGAIGRFLVERLLVAGVEVVALGRTAEPADPRTRWLRGDLAATMPAWPAVDAIFSCGPLDAFAAHCGRDPPRVARVVAIGSMSLDSKRASADPRERALAARLAGAEDALARACSVQGAALTVLRPTLVYGAGVDRSLTPIARFARRTRLFPYVPAARGLRQPVHADDVAAGCIAAARTTGCAGRTYAIGGGERLAFAQVLDRVRASLPFATLPVPVPLAAVRAGLRVAGARLGLSAALVDRVGEDLVADDATARADLGWNPRMFHPDAACWGMATVPAPGDARRPPAR